MGDTCVWRRVKLGLWAILLLASGGYLGACAAEPVVEVRPMFLPVSYDEAMAAIEEEEPRGTIGLKHCPRQEFVSEQFGPWNDAGRKALANDHEPRHRAHDVVASVGRPVRVQARVAYGEEDMSLEGEWVRVYLGKCDGWQQVGYQRTGADGVVRVQLAERLPPGVYGVAFQVVGDLSFVVAKVWVVPANTPVVVFSLSGTLKTPDGAPLPGAVALTKKYADHGYLVAYLASETEEQEARAWLQEQGFSMGALVEDFRAETLHAIREAGLLIQAAYGNAAADAQAFGLAGLKSEQIWLLSGDSWEGQAEKIEIQEPEL